MADLFSKMNKLKAEFEEPRPNLKDIEKEDKIKDESKVEVKSEIVKAVKEEALSFEEKAELDSDEREVFENKAPGELSVNQVNPGWEEQNRQYRRNAQMVNNTVGDIDNDLNKIKVILQGATNTNPDIGGSVPWDLVLAKIETLEDKSILRSALSSLIAASALFGKESKVFAYLWEEFKSELGLSRASQGFAAKLVNTQITQSFVDKNVKTHRNSDSKGGAYSSLQPGITPYG